MSQTEDQLDLGGGITDLVFDAEHQEKNNLGGFAIRDCLDQRLYTLHKSL